MRIEEIIQKIEDCTGKPCSRYGKGYKACCPAHEDDNPSLSVSEDIDGKILMHCFANCSVDSICEVLGIKSKNLFNNSSQEFTRVPLRVEYPYHSTEGRVVYRKVRIEPGKNGKDKSFYSEQFTESGAWVVGLEGVQRILYSLPEVLKAKEKGDFIYLTEGEKDSDRLRKGNLVATTSPEGAAGPWRSEYSETLKGAHVVLLYDEDVAGYGRRDALIKELPNYVASLRVIKLPGLEFIKKHGPDVSDWLGKGHTIQELKELTEKTAAYDKSTNNSLNKKKGLLSHLLPQLIVQGGAQTIQETGRVAGEALNKTGLFFIHGKTLMKVIEDENKNPCLNPIKPSLLASELELVAQIVKSGPDGMRPTVLNSSQTQLMMESSWFNQEIHKITLLSEGPVLTMDRSRNLRIVSGYDKESGILSFGNIPKTVSLEDSVNLLLNLLADFRFATLADKSRALAAIIIPALIWGQIIKARAPMIVVEADESQTGKGYLVKMVAALYSHSPRPITQRKGLGGLEDSLNERLVKGDPFISLDNIKGKIDSPAIESLLTENYYLAKIPYFSVEIDPQRLVLFFTSNQCEMTQDLANRSFSIRLRKQEQKYDFKSFSEGDLIAHVQANSSLYYGAIVAIFNEWVLRGCLETKEERHDFRKCVRVVDWIIQHIFHLPPVMEGHTELQKRVVNKQLNWLRSVSLVVLKNSQHNTWLKALDLLNLIEEFGEEIPGIKESDDLNEKIIREKALRSIGKYLAVCFKNTNKIHTDLVLIDEILIDEIKIQRRVTKENREGTSGPIEVKEYRFYNKVLFPPSMCYHSPPSPP